MEPHIQAAMLIINEHIKTNASICRRNENCPSRICYCNNCLTAAVREEPRPHPNRCSFCNRELGSEHCNCLNRMMEKKREIEAALAVLNNAMLPLNDRNDIFNIYDTIAKAIDGGQRSRPSIVHSSAHEPSLYDYAPVVALASSILQGNQYHKQVSHGSHPGHPYRQPVPPGRQDYPNVHHEVSPQRSFFSRHSDLQQTPLEPSSAPSTEAFSPMPPNQFFQQQVPNLQLGLPLPQQQLLPQQKPLPQQPHLLEQVISEAPPDPEGYLFRQQAPYRQLFPQSCPYSPQNFPKNISETSIRPQLYQQIVPCPQQTHPVRQDLSNRQLTPSVSQDISNHQQIFSGPQGLPYNQLISMLQDYLPQQPTHETRDSSSKPQDLSYHKVDLPMPQEIVYQQLNSLETITPLSALGSPENLSPHKLAPIVSQENSNGYQQVSPVRSFNPNAEPSLEPLGHPHIREQASSMHQHHTSGQQHHR